ncbi:MAG: outer membrane beta-barrel protein [Bacteroidales bacterium]|nr:outer membrane beta-barrel protein [Bacteroidales bacterium]
MIKRLILISILWLITLPSLLAQRGNIEGVITDKKTGETITGALVVLNPLNKSATTDIDGTFRLENIPFGPYKLKVNYISYEVVELDVNITSGKLNLPIEMNEVVNDLGEVVVTGRRRMNSELSMLTAQRTSLTVTNGVSSEQISKMQDKDAAEVIKRIPGISVMDEKFIISRGLSQRYNSVWINNSAVPSSEADSRSFSFDIIPSSQIENIVIVKSPAPELPADFTGGFIQIQTRNMPGENSFHVSYEMNINTATHFEDFKYNKGSFMDVLGLGNSKRSLNKFVPDRLDNSNASQVDKVTKDGFNNDWKIHTKKPVPDQRFSMAWNRRFDFTSGGQLGMIAALNYSYTSRTYTDMENSRYGVYDSHSDKPVYLYKYMDDVYFNDVKVGALYNATFVLNGNYKFEFRNMFNQIARDKYTGREGYQYISGLYEQEKTEYLYSSRLTYSAQLAGDHLLANSDKLNWTLGFSYSDKKQPDRRMIEREENGFSEDIYFGKMHIDQNEISRDFIKLDEYIYSLAVNYSHDFSWGNRFTPLLKAGLYGDYRMREYSARAFYYRWNEKNFAGDFAYRDVVDSILIKENYGSDKLYVYEDTDNRNSYKGNNLLGAGYAGLNLPFGKFNLYAGARMEYNKMTLTNYVTIKDSKTKEKNYEYLHVFPSVNTTYKLNEENLLRFAYGTSINRQEFREVSSSVYYDFDLFSSIMGNPDLQPAKIHNFDLRYEFYPSPAELVSVAFFYKHFRNPIEWTYMDAGGSYTYTFQNAEKANNFGVEIDIKKSLDFIGLHNLSVLFNGSLINSKVIFDENSQEHDRAMQGQSPFIVNTGLFYRNDKLQTDITLLYNILGKRIVGIGKVDTSEEGSINNDVPDMYEMPRNVLDLSIAKKWGKKVELTVSVRDILAQKIRFKQFPKFYADNGNLQEREQTTKQYKPGQNISLTLKLNF